MAMIAGAALTTLAAVIVMAAASGLGGPFVKLLPTSFTPIEQFAMRLLFGSGALGLVLFVLGQIIFTPLFIDIVIGVCVVLNFGWWPRRRPLSGSFLDRRNGAIYLACFVLVALGIAALANPIGSFGNDAISYHLLGPVAWLRAGKIRPVLDSSLTAFPATVETLFAAVMALSHRQAPGILGVFFAGILLVQTWGLSKRLGADTLTANISAGLAATMPVVMFTADRCFVDVPFAAFGLAAARVGFDSSNRTHLAMAGVYSGFALGTKYTGLSMLAVTGIFLLILKIIAGGRSSVFFDLCIFAGTAILIGSPWYLRNFIMLGCPIYPPPPALARIFPARAFSLSASESLQAYVVDRGKGLGRGPLDFLLLPFRFTYWTHRFHGAGGIGVAPLAMTPLGMFRSHEKLLARVWICWCLAMTVIWFMTQQEARFLVHVLVVVSVFAGFGWKALVEQASPTGRAIAWAALLVSLGYGAAYLVKDRMDSLRAVVSPSYAARRWQSEVPFASAFEYLNSAPEVKKVLILHPYVPPFYLNRPYVKIRGQYGERPVEGVNSFAEAAPRLADLAVSHVMDVRYFESDFEVPSNNSMELVYSAEDVRIYRLRNANAFSNRQLESTQDRRN